MTVVTISRQFGAGGDLIAKILAQELGYLLVNSNIINKGLAELGIPSRLVTGNEQLSREEREKVRRYFITALHQYMEELAASKSVVILGRGGQFLFADREDAFHIKIIAPFEQRRQWVQEIFKLNKRSATRFIREQDQLRRRYITRVFDNSWMDATAYDLVLNTGKISPHVAVLIALQAVEQFAENHKLNLQTKKLQGKPAKDPKSFMHPSEEEFAQVLDFYKLRWEYEPRTFPLQWDEEGAVTSAFTPDFFLPDKNLYLELTTQRQKLVREKNKKLRRLQELYPDVKVKIVYGKDYHYMLKKFGLEQETINELKESDK